MLIAQKVLCACTQTCYMCTGVPNYKILLFNTLKYNSVKQVKCLLFLKYVNHNLNTKQGSKGD